jgi:hypothetical protein
MPGDLRRSRPEKIRGTHCSEIAMGPDSSEYASGFFGPAALHLTTPSFAS